MHVKELLSLKGKVCLVTGGAGRYGRGIVEALAEADGTVVTASRNLAANEAVAEGGIRRIRRIGPIGSEITPDARRPTPCPRTRQRPTLNAQRRTPSTGPPTPDARRPAPGRGNAQR